MTMNFNYIEYLTLDRITFITLNRPEKRNAFSIFIESCESEFCIDFKLLKTIFVLF